MSDALEGSSLAMWGLPSVPAGSGRVTDDTSPSAMSRPPFVVPDWGSVVKVGARCRGPRCLDRADDGQESSRSSMPPRWRPSWKPAVSRRRPRHPPGWRGRSSCVGTKVMSAPGTTEPPPRRGSSVEREGVRACRPDHASPDRSCQSAAIASGSSALRRAMMSSRFFGRRLRRAAIASMHPMTPSR